MNELRDDLGSFDSLFLRLEQSMLSKDCIETIQSECKSNLHRVQQFKVSYKQILKETGVESIWNTL